MSGVRTCPTNLCPLAAPIGQAIHRLLLIQAFRPDRLLAMAHMFVSTNLGESFMSIMEQPLDLTHIVGTEVRVRSRPEHSGLLRLRPTGHRTPTRGRSLKALLSRQVKPNTPVLMCSVPGYDASGHVEDLAAEQNTQITSIAIGKGAGGLRWMHLKGSQGWERGAMVTATSANPELSVQAQQKASTRRIRPSTRR